MQIWLTLTDLKDLRVGERVILKWILKNQLGKRGLDWSGSI